MSLPNVDRLRLALGTSFKVSKITQTNKKTKKQEPILWIVTPFLDTKNNPIYISVREQTNGAGDTLLYISDDQYASSFLWDLKSFRPKAKKARRAIEKMIENNNTVLNNGYLFIRLLPKDGNDEILVAEQIKNLTRIVLLATGLPLFI